MDHIPVIKFIKPCNCSFFQKINSYIHHKWYDHQISTETPYFYAYKRSNLPWYRKDLQESWFPEYPVPNYTKNTQPMVISIIDSKYNWEWTCSYTNWIAISKLTSISAWSSSRSWPVAIGTISSTLLLETFPTIDNISGIRNQQNLKTIDKLIIGWNLGLQIKLRSNEMKNAPVTEEMWRETRAEDGRRVRGNGDEVVMALDLWTDRRIRSWEDRRLHMVSPPPEH